VALEKFLGWKSSDMGVFETVMPLVYGLSVFLNGPVADRIGGKKAFLFGTAGASLMNFAFGFTLSRAQPGSGAGLLGLLCTVWAINGFFQSFGALSIVKVNAQWFHVRERGTFAGVFGVLIRFGLILAFSGTPLLLKWLSLPWVFFVPAIALAVFFVLNFFFMENTPADAGLPALDTGDGSAADDDKPAKLVDVLKKVFLNRAALTVAFASMMIGCVRRSVIDAWYPDYFHQVWGIKDLSHYGPYQLAVWGIAIAGIAGGFAFGITSDNVFKGRRGPVITFGFGGIFILLLAFAGAQRMALGPWAAAAVLVGLSFFINGAHGMIGGAASMDYGGRKAAATAAGLFDGMQYIAASPMGYTMGKLLSDKAGWDKWTLILIPFSVVGLILGASLWNVLPKAKGGGHGHGGVAIEPDQAVPTRAGRTGTDA
jgi:OPA family glycerol-3-phosphate transporter-like MFS transporter